MEIFGIGPIEFIIFVFVVLLLLGPSEMAQTSKKLGRFLRRVVTSEEWKIFKSASKELSGLPGKLIREAGLEDVDKDAAVRKTQADIQENLSGLTKDLETLARSQIDNQVEE